MTKSAFEEILQRAQQELSAEDRIRLAEVLSKSPTKTASTRSVLELKGLGKESWSGIDASEYVRRERESWNG